MNEALANDLRERKQRFQSLMAAAPREFVVWAGNWFQTQAVAFGVRYDGKMAPVEAPKPEVKAEPQNGNGPNKGLPGKWVKVGQAPIVKKKAHNPISLHIPKGAHISYKDPKGPLGIAFGIAEGFTKLAVKVKVDSSGKQIKVPYHKILCVEVK